MADNLKTELVKTGKFTVLDQRTFQKLQPNVSTKKLSVEEAAKLAEDANCEAVVTGKFLATRKIIRINAQAIDSITGEVVAADWHKSRLTPGPLSTMWRGGGLSKESHKSPLSGRDGSFIAYTCGELAEPYPKSKNVYYPSPGFSKPKNIAQKIRTQFKAKNGNEYYYFFDVKKFVHTEKDHKPPTPPNRFYKLTHALSISANDSATVSLRLG